jgi:hypothetical protein
MSNTHQEQAEASRAELIQIIKGLGDTELLRLYNAAQSVLTGDKESVLKLAGRVRDESAELEKLMLNGRTPEELQKALVDDMNDQGEQP